MIHSAAAGTAPHNPGTERLRRLNVDFLLCVLISTYNDGVLVLPQEHDFGILSQLGEAVFFKGQIPRGIQRLGFHVDHRMVSLVWRTQVRDNTG